ncbi:hypothetical protein E5288_WYG008021 [Bos mutus]|uniref:Uncharacterized protein n=1 Tax=Bos mutus TaxID=72004 RepID=A0A6B0RZC5_9CETA|nr:hypothetical protein [Bos mutus]
MIYNELHQSPADKGHNGEDHLQCHGDITTAYTTVVREGQTTCHCPHELGVAAEAESSEWKGPSQDSHRSSESESRADRLFRVPMPFSFSTKTLRLCSGDKNKSNRSRLVLNIAEVIKNTDASNDVHFIMTKYGKVTSVVAECISVEMDTRYLSTCVTSLPVTFIYASCQHPKQEILVDLGPSVENH